MAIGLQWSGGPVLQFYTVGILQGFKVPISPYWAAAGLTCYQLFCSTVGTIISSILPRRKFYICSAILVSIGTCILATVVHLSQHAYFIEFLDKHYVAKWIPIVGLLFFYAGYET